MFTIHQNLNKITVTCSPILVCQLEMNNISSKL